MVVYIIYFIVTYQVNEQIVYLLQQNLKYE